MTPPENRHDELMRRAEAVIAAARSLVGESERLAALLRDSVAVARAGGRPRPIPPRRAPAQAGAGEGG